MPGQIPRPFGKELSIRTGRVTLPAGRCPLASLCVVASQELSEPDPRADASPDHAERAAARAHEARLLADEAAGRVSLSLIHAAAALDRYAARCADLGAGADANAAQLLRHQAGEYHRAAVRYREMAARYGELADSAR